jgi:endogenous inhibitor of DNA gyrase (YacG/DUF329 family)
VRIACPLCKRVLENVPEDFPPRPFCSPRCKLADLGNWLGESYRISSEFESGLSGEDDSPDRPRH